MPLLRARELGDIIDKAQPSARPVRRAGCWPNWSRRARSRPGACRRSSPFNARPDAPGSLEQRAARKQGAFEACPTAAEDIALMAFTSGTTGKPKAAVHTHRDVLAACETWPRQRPARRRSPDDIVIGSPPLAFTFGLGGMLLFPMWAGASIVLPDCALHPGIHGAHDQRDRRHHLLHRAHLLPPGRRLRARAGRGQTAHQRERWRRPARRHAAAVEGSHRHRDAGRHRRHRGLPHLHLRRAGRGPPRRHRQGRAWVQSAKVVDSI